MRHYKHQMKQYLFKVYKGCIAISILSNIINYKYSYYVIA